MKKIFLSILIAIFITSPLQIIAENITVTCGDGAFSEYTPFSSIPTYDYGPDGLVRFHLSLTPDGWLSNNFTSRYYRFSHYASDCESISSNQIPGSIPSGVSHLLIKVIETSPGWYSFEFYNEDTGDLFAGKDSFPPPFSEPVVQVSTFYTFGVSNMYGYYERGVWTPTVPVKDPNFVATKTPVLIVPGILGTEVLKGSETLWADIEKMILPYYSDSFMDPLAFKSDLTPLDYSLQLAGVIRKKTKHINQNEVTLFDYSDGLINELISQGYTEGKDLFTFPYDWRYGVSGKFADGTSVAGQLKGQIDYILTQTDAGKVAGKVDVVAHSMGGLVLKKYVQEYPSDHHIGKAVFVGVPNLGSAKAYKVLMVGDGFGITGLNDQEIKKIGQNMPAIYDLSPSESYNNQIGAALEIVDHSILQGQDKVKELDFNQSQEYLKNNYQSNSQGFINANNIQVVDFENLNLNNFGIDSYNIVGCKIWTLGKMREVNYMGRKSYYGEGLNGDGTVPIASAGSINSPDDKTFYAVEKDHSKMLSLDGSRQKIVNLLIGSSLNVGQSIITKQTVQENPNLCGLKGKLLKMFSPAYFIITDSYGNISTIAEDGSVQNDIPGASYELYGDHKYVFLPTDEGQSYTIKLQGAGDGTFTVYDQTIEGDNIVKTQVFSNLPVSSSLTGQVNFGSEDSETTLLIQQTSASEPITIHPSSILTSSQSQDLTPPISASTISGTLKVNGSYSGEVGVNLSADDVIVADAEDQTSGILNIQYNLDSQGDKIYNESSPVTVSTEGVHTMQFFSTDKAGNNEAPQSISFTIEKPAAQPVSSGGGGVPYYVPPIQPAKPVVTSTESIPQVLGEITETPKHGEGSLILFADHKTIYLIKDGIKRPFLSAQQFLKAGYEFKNVVMAWPGDEPLGLGWPVGWRYGASGWLTF